ncbi:MAG: hypothetical protein ACYTBX_19940 [Planctomycetota bacterium]
MVARKKRVPKAKGTEANHLKLEGGWKSAIKRAFRRKKPKEGWPEKEKEKRAND